MTAEQISRSYGGSILVRRWLGAWVDFVVILSIFLVPDAISHELYLRAIPLWFTIVLAYFPVMEAWTGRTVGKYATGTVVVDDAGHRPALGQVLVRTLLRVVEVNPFLLGGLPAGLAVAFSKTHQRLGDMAAGTYVVLQKHQPMISEFAVIYPEERLKQQTHPAWLFGAIAGFVVLTFLLWSLFRSA